MSDFELREMREEDRQEVAELIYLSTNQWYLTHGHPAAFSGEPAVADVFFSVYGKMEGSAGVVAVDGWSGRLIGSCFYHVRPTHVSLGIMNAHPNHFGCGVARQLLQFIIDLADREGKPVRLVSSALYTRAGFTPRCAYQDVLVEVPEEGMGVEVEVPKRVRVATMEDVEGMAVVEMEISGIRRDGDYRYFIENKDGFWHVSVCEGEDGLEGFLISSQGMLGPGVARTEGQAAALLLAELEQHRGKGMVFLVPVECGELVRQVYAWGGKNCELHFAQVRGAFQPFRGVSMPTFMPETG